MNNNTTDNFWNDDLVKEYTHDVIIKALNERTVSPLTWDEQILKFKQSKLQQPKEEQPKRFEIQGFCRSKGAISNVSGKPYNIYEFTSFDVIPEEKYEAIKLAIERELNGVGSGLVQDLGLEFNLDAYKPFLKKEKLDAMMENVWNAARDAYRIQIPNGGYRYGDIKFRYESFKDYQQSLPENKSETTTTSNASLKCQNDKLPSCCMCGGETVLIRGKYPGTDKRNVCPTCNTERLEQISEISSKDYGQNYKANN